MKMTKRVIIELLRFARRTDWWWLSLQSAKLFGHWARREGLSFRAAGQ